MDRLCGKQLCGTGSGDSGAQEAEHDPAVNLGSNEGKHVLDCISKRTASRSKEAIIPLYLASVRPYLQFSSGIPQFKRDIENLERIQQKTAKIIGGLEKLRDAGIWIFSAFQYLDCNCTEDRGTLLTGMHNYSRTRG